ncbi:hypothetical protein fHeYen902_173 [Yersinia phage fHe-Yen9-02]|nr:hypothetical protein fHeYen902_173 [Yersinia phage fHe-Yen9-02]
MNSVYYFAYLTWRKRLIGLVLILVVVLIATGYLGLITGQSSMWIGFIFLLPFAICWHGVVFYEQCVASELSDATVSTACYDKWKARHAAWYKKTFGRTPVDRDLR